MFRNIYNKSSQDPLKEWLDLKLRAAVKNGNISETLRTLKKGADPNKADKEGYSTLHYAVRKGYSSLIKHLIIYGANIEQRGALNGYKPIHLIIKTENKIECLKELMQHNVDLNSTEYADNTLLQLTVKWNTKNINFIKKLISLGLDTNRVDIKGYNCMHNLAANEKVEDEKIEIVADLFIKEGININCQSRINFETPLHVAARHGKSFLVDKLLMEGATIDAVDKDGLTALGNAQTLSMEVIRIFIQHLVLRIHRSEIVSQILMDEIKSNSQMNELYEYFVDDLKRLKIQIIESHSVTYYDILCVKKEKIANFMMNDEVMDKLSDRTNISTNYERAIQHKIGRVKEMVKSKQNIYNKVNSLFHYRLPQLCVNKISSYLNPEDVQGW